MGRDSLSCFWHSVRGLVTIIAHDTTDDQGHKNPSEEWEDGKMHPEACPISQLHFPSHCSSYRHAHHIFQDLNDGQGEGIS